MNLLAMILAIGMCGSVIDETYSALAPVSEIDLPTTPTEMVSTLLTGDNRATGIFPKNHKKYIVSLKSKPAFTTQPPKPRMPKMFTRLNTKETQKELKITDIQSRIPLMPLKRFVVEQTTLHSVQLLEPRRKRLMKKSAEIIYKNEKDENKEDKQESNYKRVINETELYLNGQNISTQTTIKLQKRLIINDSNIPEELEIFLPQSIESKDYLNEQNILTQKILKLQEDMMVNKTSVPEEVEIPLPQSVQSQGDLKEQNSSTQTSITVQENLIAKKISIPEEVDILLPQLVQSKDDLNKQNTSTKKTLTFQEDLISNKTSKPEDLEIPLTQSISSDMDKKEPNRLGGQTEADNLKYSIEDDKLLSNIDNVEKEDRKEFLFIDGNANNGMSDGPIRIDLLDGILGQLTNLDEEAESITEIALYDEEEDRKKRFVVEEEMVLFTRGPSNEHKNKHKYGRSQDNI